MRGALVAGAVLLIVLVFAVDTSGGASDFGLFVGRLHPSVVHFPIVLLLMFAGVEFLSWRGWLATSPITKAAPAVLYVGSWFAIVAAGIGLFLAQGGGYDLDTFSWHKRLGVIVALGATATYLIRTRRVRGREASVASSAAGPRSARPLAVALSIAVLVAIAGHLGATLTHGEGYLTRYMPDPLRKIAGLPSKSSLSTMQIADPAEATVFESFVRPILEDKCVACHNSSISKGGLALDTPEGLLEGSEDGEVIAAGRSTDSELIERIWLPESDDDHMPPEGRPQVTVAEAELIRWWVDDGASMERTVAEAELTPTITQIFSSWGIEELPRGVFALSIAPPDTATLSALNAMGLSVSALSEDEHLLQVRCDRRPGCLSTQRSEALRSIADAVVWFDLGSTDVGDSELELLRSMPHLTRVHLQKTAVTDAGLAALDSLEYLEYLNLYGTAVTDEGLNRLVSLRSLRSVYVWQTQVSQEGVDHFVAARPDVRVNIGG
jgi:uncharacterized membrane protein